MMKVLWLACSSACYDKARHGSWIESLEMIFKKQLKEVQLGIAFEHNNTSFKVERDGVSYYPINLQLSAFQRVRTKLDEALRDQYLLNYYLRIIDDFRPDIIQCFGTEWPYGLIAEYTDIPVIIHMMGCRNIINYSKKQIIHDYNIGIYSWNPWNILKKNIIRINDNYEEKREKKILASNKYFMGRTSWDRDIINYFSPEAIYYHCEEAIREEIYNSQYRWTPEHTDKLRFITVANPSVLKGNANILMAANILKNEFHLDFEWRLTCGEDDLLQFEKMTGLDHNSVGLKMIGRIGSDEIAKELSEALLYIHYSIIDNSPNSLCEAQLIGTPIISSNVGGISTLVKEGETGFLFPYNEPYTLAFKIMDLCRDKMCLEHLSVEERRVSHQRHDPVAIGNRVLEIYKDILNDYKKNSE